jgi:hypothetical protein
MNTQSQAKYIALLEKENQRLEALLLARVERDREIARHARQVLSIAFKHLPDAARYDRTAEMLDKFYPMLDALEGGAP